MNMDVLAMIWMSDVRPHAGDVVRIPFYREGVQHLPGFPHDHVNQLSHKHRSWEKHEHSLFSQFGCRGRGRSGKHRSFALADGLGEANQHGSPRGVDQPPRRNITFSRVRETTI